MDRLLLASARPPRAGWGLLRGRPELLDFAGQKLRFEFPKAPIELEVLVGAEHALDQRLAARSQEALQKAAFDLRAESVQRLSAAVAKVTGFACQAAQQLAVVSGARVFCSLRAAFLHLHAQSQPLVFELRVEQLPVRVGQRPLRHVLGRLHPETLDLGAQCVCRAQAGLGKSTRLAFGWMLWKLGLLLHPSPGAPSST